MRQCPTASASLTKIPMRSTTPTMMVTGRRDPPCLSSARHRSACRATLRARGPRWRRGARSPTIARQPARQMDSVCIRHCRRMKSSLHATVIRCRRRRYAAVRYAALCRLHRWARLTRNRRILHSHEMCFRRTPCDGVGRAARYRLHRQALQRERSMRLQRTLRSHETCSELTRCDGAKRRQALQRVRLMRLQRTLRSHETCSELTRCDGARCHLHRQALRRVRLMKRQRIWLATVTCCRRRRSGAGENSSLYVTT